MTDHRGSVLPIYVVVDESGSMVPAIGELNAGLESVYNALAASPMTASRIRLSVLGFSDDVVVKLHLADLRTLPAMPTVSPRGATDFAALFQDLVVRISADIAALKAEGFVILRPAVFLITDGVPNNAHDWHLPLRQLTDRAINPAAPNIVACGVGEADARMIRELATRPEFGFVRVDGVDVGRAISEFMVSLTTSIVHSGQSLGTQSPELIVEPPEGFTLAIDVI